MTADDELYACANCGAVIDPYSDDFVTPVICGPCIDARYEGRSDYSPEAKAALLGYAKGAAARLGLN
jgi:hypothetical protein